MKKLILIGITLLMMVSGSIQAGSMIDLRDGAFGYGQKFKVQEKPYWQDVSRIESYLSKDVLVQDRYQRYKHWDVVTKVSGYTSLISLFLPESMFMVWFVSTVVYGVGHVYTGNILEKTIEHHNDVIYNKTTHYKSENDLYRVSMTHEF